MIGLNYFLQEARIDLGRARLVRHQTRAAPGRSPHDLWMATDGRLEMYQRIQGKERFRSADWVIAFVATPLDETLFVGVYRVLGVGTVPPDTIDPCGEHDVTGLFLYDLELNDALREYAVASSSIGERGSDRGSSVRIARTSRSLRSDARPLSRHSLVSARSHGPFGSYHRFHPRGAERYRRFPASICSRAYRQASSTSDRRMAPEGSGCVGKITSARGTVGTRG
jgi:hypothetical protein